MPTPFKKEKPYVVMVDGQPYARCATFDEALELAKFGRDIDKVLSGRIIPGHAVIDIQNEDELDLDFDGLTEQERERLMEEI